ncbi:MAG: glycosyltransferase [Alphaproteobacteria bacterium]
MRVAYIGNFRPFHSTENEVRKAWEALGAVVLPLQEDECDWQGLPALVDSERVDLVMWTRTADLDRATNATKLLALTELEARGVPSVAYHLDRWWGLRRQHEIAEQPFFRCAVVVTADGGHQDRWEAEGVNHRWLPPAVSEFECSPGTPRDEYASDIAFVGSWQGYHREWKHRPALVRCLQHSWPGRVRFWPEPGQPSVRGDALRDLYASVKVVVGDSCLAGGATHYWSDRIPETIGRGGFLLHPNVVGLDEHFTPGTHLVTWDIGDWTALRDLVDQFLEDHVARETIADAGRAHVLKHHTYTVRMRQVIDLVNAEGYFVPEPS